MAERSLSDLNRVLGPDHPLTLIACRTVAGGYLGTGRTSEAITLYERAACATERLLGPDHPDTRNALTALTLARNSQRPPRQHRPWKR